MTAMGSFPHVISGMKTLAPEDCKVETAHHIPIHIYTHTAGEGGTYSGIEGWADEGAHGVKGEIGDADIALTD